MKKSALSVTPSFLIPLFLLFFGSSLTDILLFFLATLLHEAGHLFALGAFGYGAKRLSLSLTGAVIETTSPYIPYRKEVVIFLAGPLANGLGCGITLFLLRQHFSREGMLFFSFNALLALFNLLPIRGLDGSGALSALLCQHGSEAGAEMIISTLHKVSLALLFFLALWLLVREKNPSLLILSLSLGGKEPIKRKKATKKS